MSIALAGLAAGCGRGGAVEVEIGRVEKRPVFRSTVTASGEIVAERYADVGSSVMGKLVSLPVREGDRVRKGQVVARIDSVPASSERDAAAALVRAVEADQAAARARAEDAARALARGRELRGQGLLPQADFDALQAAADAASAQADAAGAPGRPGPRPAGAGGRPPGQDGDRVAPRRHRDPPARAGGRDGGDRHPEHAGHHDHDDLRPRGRSTPR